MRQEKSRFSGFGVSMAMYDEQLRWTTAGVRLEVSRSRDGLAVVADPDGPAPRTFEFTGGSLAGCGPAVVSPLPGDSLGLWLESRLDNDESVSESWRVVAADGSSFDASTVGGSCRLTCRGPVVRGAASHFRHDAHSLLNAIGMNADLVAMLVDKESNPKIGPAVARIRTSCDALAALITSGTRELESGAGLPVAAALDDILRRAGIDDIPVQDDEAPHASLLWCLLAGRVLIEWVDWLTGAGGVSSGALELSCNRRAVILSGKPPRRFDRPAFDVLGSGNAAAPELQPAEPLVALGGMGVGFGSWQTRGAAGVCIGIPAS